MRRVLMAASAIVALSLAGLHLGLFDGLSIAGRVHRELATASILVYWLLVCLAILLGTAFRRAPAKTGLAVFSVLLAVAAFELFAKLTALPCARLRFRGVASEKHHHLYPARTVMSMPCGAGGWTTVSTNEDGLRTPYSRKGFLAHGRRIAVLGDSFAFGLGVREEEAFPSRLEAELATATAPSVAVLNAAVISYSPFLERILFEDVVRHYRPDTVILLLDATDFADDQRYMTSAVRDGSSIRFQREGPTDLRYYGATVEVINSLIGELLTWPFRLVQRRVRPFNYDDFRIPIGDQISTNTYFHFQHPLALTRPYLEATLENITAIAADAEASGATFLLVVSPRFQHWNALECPAYDCPYDRAAPFQFEMFRFFDEVRARVNYRIIDLLPAFRDSSDGPFAFEDDPHWNPRGHARVASAVAGLVSR